METSGPALEETITLRQAKKLVQCMAHEQSFLLLSPPGVGKSDMVYQAAAEAGLPCRSLLGTQIAPEDVSGVPKIVGERSVFCPPRLLLPETPEPFCLFLDELPACAPDVQKAFYSLLAGASYRRARVAAPERGSSRPATALQDRALVRALCSALVNRVTILHLRVDVDEWLAWAAAARRPRRHSELHPLHARRAVPAGAAGAACRSRRRELGCAVARARPGEMPACSRRTSGGRWRSAGCRRRTPRCSARWPRKRSARCAPPEDYIARPGFAALHGDAARWFILNCIRQQVRDERLRGLSPRHDQSLPSRAAGRASAHAARPISSIAGARSAPTTRCSTC